MLLQLLVLEETSFIVYKKKHSKAKGRAEERYSHNPAISKVSSMSTTQNTKKNWLDEDLQENNSTINIVPLSQKYVFFFKDDGMYYVYSKAAVVQHVLLSFVFEWEWTTKCKGPQHDWSCHVLQVGVQQRKVKYNFPTLRICSKEMSDILAAQVNKRMMDWVILINKSGVCLAKTAQTGFVLMLLVSGLFLHREGGSSEKKVWTAGTAKMNTLLGFSLWVGIYYSCWRC